METIKLNKKDYDVDIFINEMREYPCIWNTSLRSYHDQIIRKNVWDELRKKFGCPGKESSIIYSLVVDTDFSL